MGFGSYDESEQERQDVSAEEDDSEAVNVHESDHDGKMTFESGASTGDLVDRLQDIKDDEEDEE